MKIFIVAHAARGGGGISVAKNLISELARSTPRFQFSATVPTGLGYEDLCKRCGFDNIVPYETKGLLSRWSWEKFRLPGVIASESPDILFNLAGPLSNPPCPQVQLIQDPHLVYPESQFGEITLKEKHLFRYHRNRLRSSLPGVRLVLCQTPVMEKRFRDTFPGDYETGLCPNAISESVDTSPDAIFPREYETCRDKFRLFVLTRYYPHKNLEIIPALLKKFKKELKDVAFILTVAADHHPNVKRFLADIKNSGLESNILNIGPIEQDKLSSYYQHSHAMFMPTLLESYSGTYIEAMNFGCPVLTSDRDFARHSCGDGAVYFEPLNVNSVFEAIMTLKNEPSLGHRLIETGRKQIVEAGKTWNEIATEVAGHFERIVSS